MHFDNSNNSNGDTAELTLTALEERQQLLAHHVRLVARKLSHALFVFGSQGGLGKSRTIMRTLDEEGLSPILINSHITPLSLYGILYKHRDDEIIFFDDVDSMFGSMAHLGLLRSALWGTPRVVTYNSSQLTDLPQSFEFTSRVVFAANVIPKKNDAFKAVLSRCDQFELSATNEEVIDLMRSVAANGFHGITSDECESIIDFIAENSDDRQISMRLLGPSIRKYQYAKSEALDWRLLIKSQLQTLGRKQEVTKRLDNKVKDLRLLQQVMNSHPESVKDQQAVWCKATGKSRASFYRTLSRYRSEVGD
jgi:hypothetical protein